MSSKGVTQGAPAANQNPCVRPAPRATTVEDEVP
jgi:hypothetical protein